MMIKRGSSWRIAPVLLGLVALLAACDNPVDGESDSHPTGIVILQGGVEVASYTHRSGLGSVTTGAVRVAANADATIHVQLTTWDGERMEMDGIEYSMIEPTVLLTPLATAAQISTDGIRVSGRAPGTTTLRLAIFHGSHLEFDAEVPLVVEQ